MAEGILSVFDLGAVARFGESHIESDSSDNGMPGLIFGEAASLDGTPEINNLFFGNAFEKVLIHSSI